MSLDRFSIEQAEGIQQVRLKWLLIGWGFYRPQTADKAANCGGLVVRDPEQSPRSAKSELHFRTCNGCRNAIPRANGSGKRFHMTQVITKSCIAERLPNVGRQCLATHDNGTSEGGCCVKQNIKIGNKPFGVADRCDTDPHQMRVIIFNGLSKSVERQHVTE